MVQQGHAPTEELQGGGCWSKKQLRKVKGRFDQGEIARRWSWTTIVVAWPSAGAVGGAIRRWKVTNRCDSENWLRGGRRW